MRCLFLVLTAVVLLFSACGPAYRTRVIDTPGSEKLKGWEKPYEVNGVRYQPMRDGEHAGFVQKGLASWYGEKFHGRRTSNGETYDMYARTAAHKTLPLGVYVKVRNRVDGRETVVRINDRGPFVKGRVIDLSYTAAKEIGVVGPGTAPVRVEALGFQVKTAGGNVVYRQPDSYTEGSYSVQVGAFTVPENARRLAASLKRRHGFAKVQEGWVGGKRFHRVRAGRYGTLEAAETARMSFEASGYRNCFVVALE